MSHDHGRRKILKASMAMGLNSAFAGLPLAAVAEAIVNGFVQRAYAETSGASMPRNYVNVFYVGAPSRYAFDQWVRLTDADGAIQPNPMVATRLAGSGTYYNSTAYETFNVMGPTGAQIAIPVFFKNSVNISSGTVQLTELLKNMMVIRGYGTGLDGHPANANLQLNPLPGAGSITGIVADSSAAAFSAVQFPNRGNFTQFSSMKGKGIISMSDGNPLAKLMEAFASPSQMKGRQLKDRMQTVIDAYSERMKKIADSGTPEGKVIGQNFRNAQAMMKKGMSDIDAYWTPALARYKNAIEGAARSTNLYGLSDKGIAIGAADQTLRMYGDDGQNYLVAPDYDSRENVGQMGISWIAEGFALSEYVISQGLGSALEIYGGDMYNVKSRLNYAAGVRTTMSGIPNDMHDLGSINTTLMTTAHFRGFSAAVLELASKLRGVQSGASNMWNETVVQVTGDFARVARSNGTGSDHGFNQMVTSIYSGAIKKGPFCVGNVLARGHNGDYNGTQGIGAEIAGYSLKGMPTPMMMASTVAEILRTSENPYRNSATPLAQIVNDEVAYNPSFGQGKTVAG